jgi:hypothetical protein
LGWLEEGGELVDYLRSDWDFDKRMNDLDHRELDLEFFGENEILSTKN